MAWQDTRWLAVRLSRRDWVGRVMPLLKRALGGVGRATLELAAELEDLASAKTVVVGGCGSG